MATDPEREPEWERPRRGGLPRPVWLAAAVALVAALGVLGLGDDENLPVDERDDPDEASSLGPLDSTRWTRHASLDSAWELAPATDGGVWAATSASGLVRWHADGEYEHHPLREEDGGAAITALASGGRDSVWVAMQEGPALRPGGADLAHFDGERWTTYPADDLPISEVAALAVEGDGDVWAGNQVGGPEGLARFDGEEWTDQTADDGLPAGRLISLAVGDDGALWAATHGPPGDEPSGAIARYEDGEWTAWHAGEELPSTHVTGVAAGGGRVWAVGNDSPAEDDPEAVLLRFDDGEWRPAAATAEVRAASVHTLTVDHEGALWATIRRDEPADGPTEMIRVEDGELTRWRGGELPADAAGSLVTADDGAVWAAIPAGVARFDGHTWTTHRTGQGPIGDHVLSATVDEQGGVWVATFGGLSRLVEGEWSRWTAADGLGDDTVAAVAVDHGTVWAGTSKGVSRFDGGEWTSWDGDDGLGHDAVASLAVAGDGDVWAAVRDGPLDPFSHVGPPGGETDGGLARFDGETWQRRDDLPLDGVPTAVAAGDDGAVWVAVRGGRGGHGEAQREDGGVARLINGEWTAWTVADGLPATDVLDVDVADGLVWAGTSDGVARFDGQRWVSAATEGDPLNLDAGDRAADGSVRVVAAETGSVWVAGGGPTGSVARFDGWAWTAPEEPPELWVTAIALTDDSAWLGTHRGVVRAPR